MSAQDIPQLPAGAVAAQARQPLERAQQELRRLLGYSGDILDMAVTYRSLLNSGLLKLEALSNIRPGSGIPPRGITGGGAPGPAGPPGSGGGGGSDPYEPDLTPPPNVTSLAAVAGITSVIVTWDVPAYSVGHGPGAVNLYVAQRETTALPPTFMDASLFYSARPATLGIAALAIEPNTRVHVWAKHVTVDGIESPDPAGGTNGVVVTTGQDVSHLLEVLRGAITRDEIDADVWRTHTFAIAPPEGTEGVSDILPFVVQTTDQVVNGVTIPRGVYMDAAYIKNLTALVARLGTAWIDNAMIASVSAGKIQTGTLWVGGRITGGAFSGWAWPAPGGTGYYLGSEGLLLGNANDGRYFQVTADGNLYAPGFNIVGGSASFSGALSGATGTFAGNLSAAGGTFSGALSAATGTFAGTLDAASVTTGQFGTDRLGNLSVTTLKIAGQAVTIPLMTVAADQSSINATPRLLLSQDIVTGGGGFIGILVVNARSNSGDAYGNIYVLGGDSELLADIDFGVRSTSGAAQFEIPITIPFATNSAWDPYPIWIWATAKANPGGSTVSWNAYNIRLVTMSGKR